MRSTNPVFTRNEQFSSPQPSYGQDAYGYGQQSYAEPGMPNGVQAGYGQAVGDRMTIDDVITKTAMTLGVLVVAAAIAFLFLPGSLLMPALLVSGIVGFVTVMVVAFRRTVSPAAVMVYAVIEGIFIGAFSSLFEYMYPGIVIQAVLGTFVAAGATLAAYKGLRIKVTSRFRKIVTIATLAFAGLMLVNFVAALAGFDLGLRTAGGGIALLPILVSVVAIVLAVANLIMDFDYAEQGVRNGLPASESWRAAFGLTVTMVWLYTEILRVLSMFRQN